MKVLFVCSANAWRSPIAEALLKKPRPDIEVDSAGTYAYHKVIEEVKDFLARENADNYVKKIPEDLDSKRLNDYDLIIVMEPQHKNVVISKCSECSSKIIVWNITDPIKLPPGYGEQIFRQLKQKVKEFAESLKVDEMWRVELKDKRKVTLRFLTVDDKNGLHRMFSSMSDEALAWSMAPYTIERIQRWIDNIQNLIPLVAEHKNKIVGYASIYKFPHPRRKGVGDLAIYLHQDFHNVGLGTAMTKKLLQLAKKERMHKIELQAIADNTIAIRLYKKFHFEIEGTSKDSFLGPDGKYHDMIHMGLILE